MNILPASFSTEYVILLGLVIVISLGVYLLFRHSPRVSSIPDAADGKDGEAGENAKDGPSGAQLRKGISSRGLDIVVSALMAFVLTWKLSPLVFAFETVRADISALLYLPGGLKGSLLGIGATAVYLGLAYLRLRQSESAGFRRLVLRFLGLWLAAFLVIGMPVIRIVQVAMQGTWTSSEEGVGAVPGLEAPDFVLPLLIGGEIPESDPGQTMGEDIEIVRADRSVRVLSALRGTPVVLNFWASWCPPCRAEFSELVLLQQQLGTDAQVVGINMGNTEVSLEAASDFALSRGGASFLNLTDLGGGVGSAYGVRSLPTTLVLDSEGIVRYRRTGPVSRDLLLPVLAPLMSR